MNRYPVWKNALIVLVVLWGFLYSLPNLYPDDPALQISHELTEISQGDLPVIISALEAAQIEYFGEEVDSESIRVRLNNLDDQLRAKTAIEEALGDSYIVALNLAPTTPAWLQAIGAGKMNLGLDLQGGVHFLMEVDMDAALTRRMEDNLSNVRTILREQRIRSRGLNPQPILESDSTYQLLQAIHQGFCCSIMPLDSGLEEPIEHLSFMQLPDASVLAPLGLVMRKTEPRSVIAEKCFAEARQLFAPNTQA